MQRYLQGSIVVQQDKVDHAEQQAETLRKHMEAWEADVQIKRRMDRMVPDKEAFQTLIVSRREEEFEQLRVPPPPPPPPTQQLA